MHCKNCDYALWNIRDRACPECGHAFRVSEHEFLPGTVDFCCPRCDHAHAGTNPRGLPERPAFDCAGCAATIQTDDTVVRITAGIDESRTRPGEMPWLERRHRGLVKAYLQTAAMAMTRPGRLMNGVPLTASAGEAIVYALITTVGIYFLSGIAPLLMWTFGLSSLGPFGMMGLGWVLIWTTLWLLLGLGLVLGLLVLWPVIAHATLRLTGGAPGGVDRTLEAVYYSAGANLTSVVPFFGPVLGWIWWLISATVMLQAAHRVHPMRAVLAMLVAPLLGAAVLGGLIAVASLGMQSGGVFGAGWTPAQQQAMGLGAGLAQYAWQNNGDGPAHALELTIGGANVVMGGAPVPFLQPGTQTTAADIPVCDGTLADFMAMSRSQQLGEIQAVLESVPPKLIAHRVGDFVFTYHGAKLNTQDPNLWVVVMIPDPDVNGTPAASDLIVLAQGGYAVTEITFGQLAAELKMQNAYRATIGLPALPDLTTVTHTSPAAGK